MHGAVGGSSVARFRTGTAKRRLVALLLVWMGMIGCAEQAATSVAESTPTPSGSASAPQATPAAPVVARPLLPPGSAARGEKLALEFECNRCHEGTGHPAASREQHCFSCHQDILAKKFPAAPEKLARWSKTVAYARVAPSLASIAGRLDADWLARFLLEPVDLRPALLPSMPRLAVTPQQASDLAAYLSRAADDARRSSPTHHPGARAAPERGTRVTEDAEPLGDVERGRQLLDERGCGACHRFTGAARLSTAPPTDPAAQTDAVLLAPDLRFTRERYSPESLRRWLADPAGMKPGTLMPRLLTTPADVRDVARYLLEAPLRAEASPPPAARLPPLERRVGFEEVDREVFSVTCRHCHADPDVAIGDGGPGNTGGFGFEPRGINLTSYRFVGAGYLGDDGERHSLFEKTPDGLPRLLASLTARRAEETGHPRGDVRGMPLGLPALSPEKIQLVETWIAQGRPR